MKVAFFKGRHPGIKGWLGVMTKWWTDGPYSHAELVVGETPDGKSICWSSTYLDRGVRQSAEQAAALAWFEQHAGEPYDVLGLLGFVWRREEGAKSKWFCSEAVAAALGWPEAWRFDPNTFAAILKPVQVEPQGVPA
jgi:hypothetical protein